jgi:hypothetical protein
MTVALKDDKKAEFNQIQQELSALGTNYSNNVLDATKAFRSVIQSPPTLMRVRLFLYTHTHMCLYSINFINKCFRMPPSSNASKAFRCMAHTC